MRKLFIVLAVAALGTACFPETRSYPPAGYENRAQVFEAYTTDGDSVMVQQDPRDGDLVIVAPDSMRGERVAMVNPDNNGRALVTRDVRYTHRYQGSGGDVVHERDPYHR
jgi:signal peptidase I